MMRNIGDTFGKHPSGLWHSEALSDWFNASEHRWLTILLAELSVVPQHTCNEPQCIKCNLLKEV
ncbi:hypothetical protein DPMN_153033 [Dreissena polymorpha]|uniref:Uncharacterized protein n=1 Tax=Dreissena polymorpha TaxID=45954 RepID=A0A9D4FN11_DREPO|nr:hypothetical protein DPMN_153033 [Dreissena polymorpha]